jgi:hypothetical protein
MRRSEKTDHLPEHIQGSQPATQPKTSSPKSGQSSSKKKRLSKANSVVCQKSSQIGNSTSAIYFGEIVTVPFWKFEIVAHPKHTLAKLSPLQTRSGEIVTPPKSTQAKLSPSQKSLLGIVTLQISTFEQSPHQFGGFQIVTRANLSILKLSPSQT